MDTPLAWHSQSRQSVIGRLEERSAALVVDDAGPIHFRTRDLRLASRSRPWENAAGSQWGPSVLVFLFALPGSSAIKAIDANGDYFSVRSGRTWDLFLPGYVAPSGKIKTSERTGDRYARTWIFDSEGFDTIRGHVEAKSGGRWKFSGGTDLVLVNTWLSSGQDPAIDWASTAFGSLSETTTGTTTIGLAQVIERISRDLQENLEDPMYGVGEIQAAMKNSSSSSIMRDLFISVTSDIVATVATKASGI